MKQDKLAGKVIVITGATSGIGREVARQCAVVGARLVLCARGADALEQAGQECEAAGAEVLTVVCDVRDDGAVAELARRAAERFGRIDIWVNNAAVYMMGHLEDVPAASHRRLIETNVLGVIHGCLAALAQFRVQGNGRRGKGTLINIASVAGKAPYRYGSTYCASKHAVRAITETLRQELRDSDIEVCSVVPASVDTPLFQHAANYTGREVVPMPPVYPVARVARAVVSCMLRPRREVVVGAMPRMMTLLHMLLPGLYERLQARMVEKKHLGEGGVPHAPGNLFEPHGPVTVSGGWKQTEPRTKWAQTSKAPSARRIAAAGGTLVAAGAAFAAWRWSQARAHA